MEQPPTRVPANTLGDFYYRYVALSTAFIALLGLAAPQFLQEVEVILFVLIIFVIGIPHGATDHLLDRYSKGKKFSYRAFLLIYIMLGAMYAVLWYFLPLLSLLIFITISTYHFGQSQLLYLRMSQHHWLKIAGYMLWGSYTLCCIILLNWNESWQILDEIFPGLFAPLLSYIKLTPYLLGFLLVANISLFTLLFVRQRMSRREFMGELFNLALIIGLAYYTPLLVGFAIYFGLWHSLVSVRIEIKKVRVQRPYFSVRSFAKTAIPLSVSTLIIFAFVFLFNQQWGLLQSPYLLFFILISILTLPHVFFVQEFYTTKATR
ncbi:Brp/Blh family beta-carotene 15,15'-dioxygenase [Tunicatimonas pelagia]|uniref:Brp/Blh family beta-carotene 15,15'-dioxygenase n=1 Tax=Tunicatimonas pelagia TaxID=931531 RepID=UPI0026662C0C|nr:Brp/Blh family beta-carotene 15,15'-dioxygenase [Tunicatimonas pelagia]WKN43793.1 Brp/Blh family beta-carotene 15,15'-dioxygenase [Tunicatimonas pelagia]